MTPSGTQCTVVGWGDLSWKGQKSWNSLQKVNVPIIGDQGSNEIIGIEVRVVKFY